MKGSYHLHHFVSSESLILGVFLVPLRNDPLFQIRVLDVKKEAVQEDVSVFHTFKAAACEL